MIWIFHSWWLDLVSFTDGGLPGPCVVVDEEEDMAGIEVDVLARCHGRVHSNTMKELLWEAIPCSRYALRVI